MPDPVLSFLLHFLDRWDGKESRQTILGVLAYLPMNPFKGVVCPIRSPSFTNFMQKFNSLYLIK